jgi:DNA-binding transcriptional LysR family regulator
MQPNPTLDQLQVFLAVVEKGSFSAASHALNRAQSVVSYSIANLEAQLGVALFDRSATRRPVLTEAGEAVLEDARRLLADLDVMRARIKSMQDGLEGRLVLAISVMVPSHSVVAVLRAFRDHLPSVTLGLTVGELGVVMDAVSKGEANVGFGGAAVRKDDLVMAERIGHSFLIPVAAPDHPLGRLGRSLTLTDVREEIQLVVADSSGLTDGRNFNVLSNRTWRVSDVATKHQLICAGLGWGGLPGSLIWEDLQQGRLVHLQLPAYEQGEYPIYAMTKLSNPPGPAARWLIEAFRAQLSRCPGHNDLFDANGHLRGRRDDR